MNTKGEVIMCKPCCCKKDLKQSNDNFGMHSKASL